MMEFFARHGIPHLGFSGGADNSLAVGTVCHAEDGSGVPRKLHYFFAGGHVPDSHGIIAVPTDYMLPIGAECDTPGSQRRRRKALHFLAGGHIPYRNNRIAALFLSIVEARARDM